MVFFNYATMQMAAKIVYYGPGLCGKTTNLHHIYTKTAPQSRGEMVSLETETDRTLFFDLLPIDVGVIGGFKTRLQLYTVPGQVFYNTTRKLVLKGVDGIVFVADSQRAMLEANAESFRNLRENLAEIGLNLDEIPLVMQLNKRDLPSAATVDEMLNVLDPERKFEHAEAVAYIGTGVFETLKLISKLTLRTLRRRMTGDEPAKPAPTRPSVQFKVQSNDALPSPARTIAANTPLPSPSAIGSSPPPTTAPSPSFATPAAAASTMTAPAAEQATQVVEPPPAPAPAPPPETETFADSALAKAAANVDARILSDVPVADPDSIDLDEGPSTQYIPPPSIAKTAAPAPAPAPEPEIDFSQTEKPVREEKPEVKTVKVRSSVDVMAELEALRKRATTQTPAAAKPKKDSVAAALADLAAPPKPKRDIQKTLTLQTAADVLPRAKSLRVTVSFEDANQGVIQSQEQQVELGDASDVQSLALNLKFDLG